MDITKKVNEVMRVLEEVRPLNTVYDARTLALFRQTLWHTLEAAQQDGYNAAVEIEAKAGS